MTIVRYNLSGFSNLRDGGGMSVPGGYIRTMRLLRSDNPTELDAQDVSFLRDADLNAVIDLRTEFEVLSEPSQFKHHGFAVKHNSIMAGSAASMLEGTPSVEQMYMQMIKDGGRSLAKAVTGVASGLRGGSVVVHCTAGKDRTGIVIALIQDLLGVDRSEIVASYALTQENLRGPWVEKMQAQVKKLLGEKEAQKLTPLMSDSPPQAITAVFDHLDKNFGGSLGYLTQHKMDPAIVEQLREALVRP
ncbi:tyrosine-protein phosphatase [Actinomyces minihominis]|uniref:tyrosine-protein phosphatase n=1 Tax=Actinomyces minihominis TaxID=2002838 RepID=UPI000C08A4CA|nr:tyrosine-protein phosphatase [Actinomyces minihominis]